MAKPKSSIKLMFKQRLYFLLEILTVFLGIFLFLLIPSFVPALFIDTNSIVFEPIYFFIRAFVIVAAIPIFLIVANFALEPQRKKIILKEDISSAKKFLKLYGISKSNYKYQLLYGILLLFLVFIPLDFFTYLLLPDVINFQVTGLDVYGPVSLNSYLLESYLIFIISVIIIQSCISIYEESLFRGLLSNRGSDYIHNMSAVMISSFAFGLRHFSYVFTSYTITLPLIYPFIWFLQAFFLGIILAMIVLRRRWLFPVIFAHAANNIISAHVLWNYLQGNTFFPFAFFLYYPLLMIGLMLLIWEFPRIKDSLKIGFREFTTYFRNDIRTRESTKQKIIRILADFLFGLIIFFIGIVLV